MYPILFHIPSPWGPVPIYSYGVMLGLSLILAWYFIMWLGSKKENLSRELMANSFIVSAIAALIASRVLYILTNLDDFPTLASWFQFRSGGLVAYGGFLGGWFAAWGYLRLKKVPILAWADLVAPTLGSGLLFTRIGCYLYGCDFGARLPADAPGWLKSLGTFPHWPEDIQPADVACSQDMDGSPAWNHHVREYDLPFDADASFAVHPTQIYESVAGLTLFAVGMFVWSRRSFRGQVILIVAGLYGSWRFFVETIRDDPERGAALGFSTSQLISIALVPICAIAYIIIRKRVKEHGDVKIPRSALQQDESDEEKKPKRRGKRRAVKKKGGAAKLGRDITEASKKKPAKKKPAQARKPSKKKPRKKKPPVDTGED